ncbi:head-tail connector protein [Stagnihabitans tardus]|uniref:Phage gp6-like head-tail connector protein n=1 Tax=Stagnihabitans tardus TaxID=2699202 RepID=A0AAE5BV40_9RHOB|nr:head-tail connector protein [Stagnihabitans tardus]NBZ87907.1 phage gp6-like head-tail connector protein [Stagnihabitans tardus]
MAIVTLAQVKEELAFTADLGATDDAMLTAKIDAAQDHVERLLGYKIETQYGTAPGQEPIPASLRQAVMSLAAHWYEQRGAVGREAEAPYWIEDIVSTYRGWTF